MDNKNVQPGGRESLEEEYVFLSALRDKLLSSFSYEDKLVLIENYPQVKLFFSQHPMLILLSQHMPVEKIFILKIVVLIGQGHIFEGIAELVDRNTRLTTLLGDLWQVEYFYKQLGGIVGYQKMLLELMLEQEKGVVKNGTVSYEAPHAVDLSENKREVREAIVSALMQQERLAECYPVGGAGDRLDLRDEKGNGLPAARLKFLGRTLLEGMFRDLAAREYLCFELYGKQIETPVLLMTSREKDNHNYVRLICNQQNWFGRKKGGFFFITQPLVPACDETAKWVITGPLKLVGKPNGHGALLHLAKQKGGYNWIEEKGRDYLFFRQVNNPVAATDNGLLAFIGTGYIRKKEFGFASCERLPGTKEGMNVIKKIVQDSLSKVALSNVEYCDIGTEGLLKQGDAFPANTNMLLMKLEPLRKAVEENPFPGLLINYKAINLGGRIVNLARLESTMQNIADSFEPFDNKPLSEKKEEDLKAYITINKRRKTLSAIKKSFTKLAETVETPEACYLDILQNAKELLENHCHFEVPPSIDLETFLREGPSFLFFYHPALGPLYEIIGQKIRKGKLHVGAEWNLEIADVDIENLEIEGSLTITTSHVMGHFNTNQQLIYSSRRGKCILHNVQVKNRGVVREVRPKFWKNRWKRHEECRIELGENAEFIAKNVIFKASFHVQVPKDYRYEVSQNPDGSLHLTKTLLKKAEPLWHYTVDGDYNILLEFFRN